MYVSHFSYVWTPESPPIWERAADSVYHLSHLFTDVTSCYDFFPMGYCGRGSDCISLIVALFNLQKTAFSIVTRKQCKQCIHVT